MLGNGLGCNYSVGSKSVQNVFQFTFPDRRNDGSGIGNFLEEVASRSFPIFPPLASLPSPCGGGTGEGGSFLHRSLSVLFFASVPSPPLSVCGGN